MQHGGCGGKAAAHPFNHRGHDIQPLVRTDDIISCEAECVCVCVWDPGSEAHSDVVFL